MRKEFDLLAPRVRLLTPTTGSRKACLILEKAYYFSRLDLAIKAKETSVLPRFYPCLSAGQRQLVCPCMAYRRVDVNGAFDKLRHDVGGGRPCARTVRISLSHLCRSICDCLQLGPLRSQGPGNSTFFFPLGCACVYSFCSTDLEEMDLAVSHPRPSGMEYDKG